jgi:hypothetical protein
MKDPVDAREALVIEAIGDVANLIESVERLTPELREMRREIDGANAGLRDSLSAFEAQVLALTEKAKVQAVKHILARTDEAARRSIDLPSRAMADAARVAFGADLGAALQRLQSLQERSGPRWEEWLTHAAAAVTASAVTWALAVMPWAR